MARLEIGPTIKSMSTSIRPNNNDILLGRGGNNHSHCGNEQLRRIAHERAGEYGAASKKEKAVISRYALVIVAVCGASFYSGTHSCTRQILRHIRSLEPPGRFLTKNYSTYEWELVTDAVAREKICQVSLLAHLLLSALFALDLIS